MTDGELLPSIGPEQSEDIQGKSDNEAVNIKRLKNQMIYSNS